MNYKVLTTTNIAHSTGFLLSVEKDMELDSDQLLPESLAFHLKAGNLKEIKPNANVITLTQDRNSVVVQEDKSKAKQPNLPV